MQTLEHERRLVARERETARGRDREAAGAGAGPKNREETFRRRIDERIEERLREARREIDAIVERLEGRTETMATQAERAGGAPVPTGQTGGARADARAALDSHRRSAPPQRRDTAGNRTAAGAADRLSVASGASATACSSARCGSRACVQALYDRDAEVDVRGKRLRARSGRLARRRLGRVDGAAQCA